MAKVTYLLGAGASANTIPVVADFHTRLVEVRDSLFSSLPSGQTVIKPFVILEKQEVILKGILEDFDWLIKMSGSYYTIDTLAKKFYLAGEPKELSKLKKTLITYFTLEQYIFIQSHTNKNYHFEKKNLEMRYDSFIAAISKRNHNHNKGGKAGDHINLELNNDIKIISWNYDIQFELSLQRFARKRIHFLQTSLQIFPHKNSLYETDNVLIDSSRFSMVKMNGNAIWDEFGGGEVGEPQYTRTVFDVGPEFDTDKLLQHYLEKYEKLEAYAPFPNYNNSMIDMFNFAWENNDDFREKYAGYDKNLETAELIASDTEILVVIGYSFPVFNREIDNKLFAKMNKLEKVYIQDKNPERIKSTMENAFNVMQRKKTKFNTKFLSEEETNTPVVEILTEAFTNQFVIPYELNQ